MNETITQMLNFQQTHVINIVWEWDANDIYNYAYNDYL